MIRSSDASVADSKHLRIFDQHRAKVARLTLSRVADSKHLRIFDQGSTFNYSIFNSFRKLARAALHECVFPG